MGSWFRLPILTGCLICLLLTALGHGPSLAAPAEMAPLAARSLLLDGQVVGDRLVVVGARGHILVSDDDGRTWQQRPVPTRTTLTSVFFVNDQLGWAAGHDAVILKTEDGGTSWRMVYQDRTDQRPVLDLWFRNQDIGYAVGAYGLFLSTADGGETWTGRSFEAEETLAGENVQAEDAGGGEWYESEAAWPMDFHLNHLRASPAGRLFIAGEAGHVFRSDDGGDTWSDLLPPYEGSLFGTLPLGGDVVLAYGLRGHLLASADAGVNWAFTETRTEATLNDAIQLADGRIVVAGLAGTLLVSDDGGRTYRHWPQPDRAGLARVLEADDGGLVLIGTHGVRRFSLSPTAADAPLRREDAP